MIAPNTNGQWMVADGYPLLEIMGDGSGINDHSRPAGYDSVSLLQSDGDKAAFTWAEQDYFFGTDAAAAFKTSLDFWAKLPRLATDSPSIAAYKDGVDAANAARDQLFLPRPHHAHRYIGLQAQQILHLVGRYQ